MISRSFLKVWRMCEAWKLGNAFVWVGSQISPRRVKKDSNNPSPGRTSLPADVLWGSFLTHSSLPDRRGGEMNVWRTNPRGRLWGGYGRIRSVKYPTPGPTKTIKSPPHALPSPKPPPALHWEVHKLAKFQPNWFMGCQLGVYLPWFSFRENRGKRFLAKYYPWWDYNTKAVNVDIYHRGGQQ